MQETTTIPRRCAKQWILSCTWLIIPSDLNPISKKQLKKELFLECDIISWLFEISLPKLYETQSIVLRWKKFHFYFYTLFASSMIFFLLLFVLFSFHLSHVVRSVIQYRMSVVCLLCATLVLCIYIFIYLFI